MTQIDDFDVADFRQSVAKMPRMRPFVMPSMNYSGSQRMILIESREVRPNLARSTIKSMSRIEP